MPRQHASVSQEDYLKAIWELVKEEQTPISARLAEDLDVTPPAVTAALKRMTHGGYLRVSRKGVIQLTGKGRAAAQHLVLRHRLAEKLLTEVIGLEWSRAHEEAERLEHGISPDVAVLLLKRFGKDSFCPHGVPLVGGMARLRRIHGARKLSEMAAGMHCEVMRVHERDMQFLEFVSRLHLQPGAKVRVQARGYDETMTLHLDARRGRPIHLSPAATDRIWVRHIP
jgi:DtxR family Mn-dependent transcriptional regulator